MDGALRDSDQTTSIAKTTAFQYRDGLLIALLAAVLLRRGTLASLRIGAHLLKSGDAWALDIPAADTKTRCAQEFSLSPALSNYIDVYLKSFRARIPGANTHDGIWASNKGRPMDDGTIYDMVCRRTRAAFGFAVNLHRFRHAAVTSWSIQDPKNVRGTKDLLGHASFDMTEKHYSMSQSRVAARTGDSVGFGKDLNQGVQRVRPQLPTNCCIAASEVIGHFRTLALQTRTGRPSPVTITVARR